jgi:polyisoprenoid-binding protein YceI
MAQIWYAVIGFLWMAFLPIGGQATQPSTHTVVKSESFIAFFATINGASSEGRFTDYDVKIHFDPAVPEESYASGEVRLSPKTITSSYEEVAQGLQAKEWLDTENHPKASFEFKSFELNSPNNYKGYGTLTLLGKTFPLNCYLVLNNRSDGLVVADAVMMIDRLAYGVGKGEWADTETIEKMVTVNAHLVTKVTEK